MSISHLEIKSKPFREFTMSLSISTGLNGRTPSNDLFSTSTNGQLFPILLFLNFLVASRYLNGLSIDFPNTGIGTTQ